MLESVSKSISNGISLIHYGRRDSFSNSPLSDPGTGEPSRAETLSQVDRIIKSHHLYGSDMLCKLLEYLAQHSLNSPHEHLKEYQIATGVLSRSSDFDPRSDASVRVQVGRLRSKLTAYYLSTGAQDPIFIDIPKGGYAICLKRRTVAREPAPPEPDLVCVSVDAAETATLSGPTIAATEHKARHNLRFVLPALGASVLLAGGLLASFLPRHTTPRAEAAQSAAEVPAAFRIFWSPFLRGSDAPFVIFSNAAFIGDAESGLRYFDPARDSQDRVTHHYTGVGEVMDVVELDRMFLRFNRQFRIKPSGLFTLDDALNNNLIFVGSPTENTTLRQIPGLHEFAFRHTPEGTDRWNQIIVDLHPRAGEASAYVPTPRSRPLEVDYAIIAFSRGLDPNRWMLFLGGTSTIGTQAAVDFVCNRNSLEQLLRSMNVKSESDLQPFEALLRVKVANDVPLESRLVLLRRSGK